MYTISIFSISLVPFSFFFSHKFVCRRKKTYNVDEEHVGTHTHTNTIIYTILYIYCVFNAMSHAPLPNDKS